MTTAKERAAARDRKRRQRARAKERAMLVTPLDTAAEHTSAIMPAVRYDDPTPIDGIGVPMMSNDRVAIIGATGSGKTWLASRMLRRVPTFVVLTADADFTLDDVPIVTAFDPALSRQIVCILDTFATDEAKSTAWGSVERSVFHHGNRGVYYDELSAINPCTTPRASFSELVTQGRKRNIGVWCGMQRPRGVPRIALSQAEHFSILSTTDPEDRKYIAQFSGAITAAAIPHSNRAVLYCNVKEQWTQYTDLDSERRTRAHERNTSGITSAARAAPATIAEIPALTDGEIRELHDMIERGSAPGFIAETFGIEQDRVAPFVTRYAGQTFADGWYRRWGIGRAAPQPAKATARVVESSGPEQFTITRAKLDSIRQREYDKGVRDATKQGARPQRIAASTPPSYPAHANMRIAPESGDAYGYGYIAPPETYTAYGYAQSAAVPPTTYTHDTGLTITGNGFIQKMADDYARLAQQRAAPPQSRTRRRTKQRPVSRPRSAPIANRPTLFKRLKATIITTD